MISKEDSGSKIDLEEIQESADEEPIVNTDTQPEVVTPVKPDDIALPIRSKPSQFYYGFHIAEDKISDTTLSELDDPANYKEAMASHEATKWKEAMKSEIQSMYDNQMDIKTAFLNEKLTKDMFMAQPEGFENANGRVVVFLVSYVDDILLIGNDILTLQSIKDWLGKCFTVKDLGDVAYILSTKIYKDRSKRHIGLSQDTYLDKILKRFKMENYKKENLPLHHGIKISKDLCLKTDEALDKMSRFPYALAIGSIIMSQVPYASAVGLIMYAMTCTRPDVSFALSMEMKTKGEQRREKVTLESGDITESDQNKILVVAEAYSVANINAIEEGQLIYNL
uniref:Reverse transcriptase Ty1/copia-type domain-containing protein n=1 Tax=Tanacetum cinerariifolium TaxID=118510 RepID=A0A6L2M9P4_TANCI|nr:hypothetical protein [Tanacetum cinerariifolium]